MKKKLATLLISGCVIVSLVGCGSKELSNDNIKISKYKGVEVDEVEATKVTDAQVESRIESILDEKADKKDIKDRAVKDGDIVNIDYTGKLDGTEFEGGSAKEFDLEIGSDTFIDGFEDGIIGHKVEETFDMPITFPADYGNTTLAGKEAVFTITIHKVTEKKVSKLNDKFVKKVSKKSKTVAEYKKEIKAELKKESEKEKNKTLGQSALQVVLENTKVNKYPKSRVNKELDNLKKQYQDMAKSYDMEFADFLQQQMGMTEDEFNKQAKEVAKSTVKQKMAVELIADKEGIDPTDDEYTKAYKQYVKDYGYKNVKALKKAATEDTLKAMVLQDQVCEWLAENCVQVEKEDESKGSTTDESDDSKDKSKTQSKDTSKEEKGGSATESSTGTASDDKK